MNKPAHLAHRLILAIEYRNTVTIGFKMCCLFYAVLALFGIVWRHRVKL